VTGSLVSAGTRERVRGMATSIATALGRLGLTPNALTVIGFIGTCVAAWAAASQLWLLAGVLVLAFGIFDLFDGTLARATGRTTKLGAFLDSTFDRAGEGIVYIGIAAGCLAAGYELGAILAASAMAAAFMVSYTRAKAESLGFAGTGMANIGLAPREVRTVILVVGLLIGGALSQNGALVVDCSAIPADSLADCWGHGEPVIAAQTLALALGTITVLASITTIQRVLHVRSQAKEG
jgi:CDP-diacylglycerol--glycerol-3-phosphate 3-phosphatidyltransferase